MSVSVTGPQGQMDGAQSRGASSRQSRQASPRSFPAEVRGQRQHFGEDFYTSTRWTSWVWGFSAGGTVLCYRLFTRIPELILTGSRRAPPPPKS